MIFDRVEWDEHNLGHATRRLTAAEIEQAIWNADRMFPSRKEPDRGLFRSVTDRGKDAVVVVQILRDGVRPITG
ncbi:hypothetical protein [Pseudactinotalea sp. Z1732]|uniref:hypothetical protein n=1 Tax=Micrococcales TaxID=85006 RepID=UPI003C7EAF0F